MIAQTILGQIKSLDKWAFGEWAREIGYAKK